MEEAITEGVQVQVEAFYLEMHSLLKQNASYLVGWELIFLLDLRKLQL